MSSILSKLFLSTAVLLPLTAGENAFARNLGSGSATVGAGSPIDWWTVYDGANLFVTDGGKTADIQVLSASAVTMNGGIINPRNGYNGLRFFGGTGTISNSTINGTVALEQDWFAGSPALVSITGSSMQGVIAYGSDTKLEISGRSAIVEATPGRNGVNATNHGIVNISDSTINVLAFSGHTGGIGAAARNRALITMKNTDIVVKGGEFSDRHTFLR